MLARLTSTPRLRGCLTGAALVGLLTLALGGCAPKDKVVGQVNGTPIQKEEFFRQLERAHGVDVLTWMIFRQLIQDECARLKIQIPEAELTKAVEDWKKGQGFVGEQAFLQFLQARNMTPQDLRDDLELEMLKQRLRTRGVTVTDDEVKSVFEKNKDKLGRPALVTTGEVVCDTLEKAQAARKKLQGGASLKDVIAEYLLKDPVFDQLRQQNGIWPPRPKESIYPTELRDPIFNASVGEVLAPIKSSMNVYHVVQVIERSAPKPAVFDEVKDRLREQLIQRKGKTEDQLMRELAAKAKVTIQRPGYQVLAQQFGTPAVTPGTVSPSAVPSTPSVPTGKAGAKSEAGGQ